MSLGWSKVDEVLFAAIARRNGARYQLIAERLPDTDGRDWAVWRLGDAPRRRATVTHLLSKPRSGGRGCGPALG